MAEGKAALPMIDRLRKFSILVVDDDKLMQRLISDVLGKLGFGRIQKTGDGEQALLMLKAAPFDFVICDWRMPGMSGLEFVRHVRAADAPYSSIPVIMLTGNAEAEQVSAARDAGINEYLIKPFTVKSLCQRIEEIIEKPREYVVSSGYKGPSQRRRALPPPSGMERRNVDRLSRSARDA